VAGSKALVWLVGKVKTPPLTMEARRECGIMLIADTSDDDAIAMHRGHPRRNVAVCRERVERECERGVPAERA